MTVKVKYFGLVADKTKKKEEEFFFENDLLTLQQLQSKLEKKYPELENTIYSFAINQSLSQLNYTIKNNDEIDLLPPFAGG